MKILKNLVRCDGVGYLLIYNIDDIEEQILIHTNRDKYLYWTKKFHLIKNKNEIDDINYFRYKKIKFGEEWNMVLEKDNRENNLLFDFEDRHIVLMITINGVTCRDSVLCPSDEDLWKDKNPGPYERAFMNVRYGYPFDDVKYVRVVSCKDSHPKGVVYEYPTSKKAAVDEYTKKFIQKEKAKKIFCFFCCINYY
jgi:hypothetical protein